MTTTPTVSVPVDGQSFSSEQDWINRASRVLTAHPAYNNAEHGEAKGWRGHHFTALSFDQAGNRMRSGADFKRATNEATYPVWWIWPDQIPAALAAAPALTARHEAQTPGVGAWVVRSPNGNVRYWSHDEALTKRNAAKWGLEAMHEALGPSPFRPSEGEVDDALSEVSKRIPDTILHGNSFGHEGFYPHAAVKTLVAAVYSGLSSSSITATQPDRGVVAVNIPIAPSGERRLCVDGVLYSEDQVRAALAKPADGGLRGALEEAVLALRDLTANWPSDSLPPLQTCIRSGNAINNGDAALAAGESGE